MQGPPNVYNKFIGPFSVDIIKKIKKIKKMGGFD